MGDRSDDFDKWDDRLKRIEDLQRGWGGRDFVDLDKETNLSPELEFAVSTFVRLRYRNFDVWEVCKTYSFADEGIKLRIYVQPARGEIRFTDEEAITIAANLANKHLSQSDENNSDND